jgi:hypothetical protein
MIVSLTTGSPAHRLMIKGTEYDDAIVISVEVPKQSIKDAAERRDRSGLWVAVANESIAMLRRMEEEASPNGRRRRKRRLERARIADTQRKQHERVEA